MSKSPSYRTPEWLEQSANAPGVDPKKVELHKRLNVALEGGDTRQPMRLMHELNRNYETEYGLAREMSINVQNFLGDAR